MYMVGGKDGVGEWEEKGGQDCFWAPQPPVLAQALTSLIAV